MLDPTFRARTAHIVQFRSIGAERITDSPPQLAHRSREFTAHDTLPLPLTYDPLFNRSKRVDQTSKVSKATSARPPPSIDQSPMSKPRSRRSVLVYTVMSSSYSSNHKVADKWRLDCCRDATTDEK